MRTPLPLAALLVAGCAGRPAGGTATDTEPPSVQDTDPGDTDVPVVSDPPDLSTGGGVATRTWPDWAELGRYRPAGDAFTLDEVGGNLSGITWNPDTSTYFVVRDSGGVLFEYSADLRTVLRQIQLDGLTESDLEGIAWLGDARFAIANEGNRPILITIPDDGATRLHASPGDDTIQELVLPPAGGSNSGLEGICYDPSGSGTFYAVQEHRPMRVFTFPRPAHGDDVTWADGSLDVRELFDAEVVLDGIVTDLSGCAWNPHVGRLLLLSHESSRLVDIDLSGEVLDRLDLRGLGKAEGVTLGAEGALVVVGEPDDVVIHTAR